MWQHSILYRAMFFKLKINLYDLVENTQSNSPDSKVHGDNMGLTWVLSAPDGPHVGPIKLAIKVIGFVYRI